MSILTNRKAVSVVVKITALCLILITSFIGYELGWKAGRNEEGRKLYFATDLKEYCYTAQAVPGNLIVEYDRNLKLHDVEFSQEQLSVSLAEEIVPMKKTTNLINLAEHKNYNIEAWSSLYITNPQHRCVFVQTYESKSSIKPSEIKDLSDKKIVITPETRNNQKDYFNAALANRLQTIAYDSDVEIEADLTIRTEPGASAVVVHYGSGAEKLALDISQQLGASAILTDDVRYRSGNYIEVHYSQENINEVQNAILFGVYRFYDE